MRVFLFALGILSFSSAYSFAATPAPESVSVVEEAQFPSYENIPQITQAFAGESGQRDRGPVKEKCQKWVIEQLAKLNSDKVLEFVCLHKVDVVARQHLYRGLVVLKNW